MLSWLKPHHYWSILFAQIFLILLATFMEDHPILYALFALSLLGIFGSVIMAIWKKALLRILALISGVVAVAGGFLWVIPGIPEHIVLGGILDCVFAYALFILIAILSISKNVFVTDRVTADRIVGSICIYLLIGMFFAFIYAALGIMDPASFDLGGETASTIENFRDYLYFSYTTLTTTGFGDMVPTRPLSRAISGLESITGSIYLVIMVARLVGMHISQSIRKGNET